MATPSQVFIDDRDPSISYAPNGIWNRGGNALDYQATSTWTPEPGATASYTFTGTDISVWGTITYLQPGTPTYVLSSYSVDNGPATIHNATEAAQFTFQQKFFQSNALTPTSHTLVVTHLASNAGAALFIDYFLVVPPGSSAPGSSAPAPPSPAVLPPNSSSAASLSVTSAGSPSSPTILPSKLSSTASLPVTLAASLPSSLSSPAVSNSAIPDAADAKSHSGASQVPIGAIVGGLLGGLALLLVAFLAFWFLRQRVKSNHRRSSHVHPDPFTSPVSEMEQYQPQGSTYNISTHQATLSSNLPTSPMPSSRMIPPSKGGERAQPSPITPFPLEKASGSHILSESNRHSMDPPEYDE